MAQTPSESRFRVGIMSGVDYGFTTGDIMFTPPSADPQYQLYDSSFKQNGFSNLGYTIGLFGEIPLSNGNTDVVRISGSYQQQQFVESITKYGAPSVVIKDGKETVIRSTAEAKTTLITSSLQSNILYCTSVFPSFRCNVGVALRALTRQYPVEQTYSIIAPVILDPEWSDNMNWKQTPQYSQSFTNQQTASQSASIQLGGVAGLDYALNISSFYIMPFVQYTMMFTSITKETPIRLNALSTGIGVGMYL